MMQRSLIGIGLVREMQGHETAQTLRPRLALTEMPANQRPELLRQRPSPSRG